MAATTISSTPWLGNFKDVCDELSVYKNTTATLLSHLENALENLGNEEAKHLTAFLSKTTDLLRGFSNMSQLRTFLRQAEIRQTLDDLQRKIWSELRMAGKMSELDIESQQASYEINHTIDRLESAKALSLSLQSNKTSVDDIRNLPAKELVLLTESIRVERSAGSASSRVLENSQHMLRDLARKAGLTLPDVVHLPDLTSSVSVNYHFPVGGGGLSDVFKASTKDKDSVAVKVLRIHYSSRKEPAKRRALREASIWIQLRHPNILPCLGIVDPGDDAPLSIVSPWMNNGTIMSYLERNPQAQTLHLVEGVARGLEYLHNRQPDVIHGDLTSSNVLISDSGDPLLAGFGLASIDLPAGTLPEGVPGGRTAYRWSAPELIENNAEYPTKEADIWAFGMTVYQVITGHLPYHDRELDPLVVIALHQKKLPQDPDPDNLSHQSNGSLWELVKQCWIIEPPERPNARDILARVQDIAANVKVQATGTVKAVEADNMEASSLELESDQLSHIAPGIFGATKRAVWSGHGRVALKVLRTPKPRQAVADYTRKLTRELKHWVDLHCKNLLTPIGVVRPVGLTESLMLPWMKNGDAFSFVSQNPERSCLPVLEDIARGLSYLHSNVPGIVHGDLKATNVLIADSGEAVLCDFGLAGVIEDLTGTSYQTALDDNGNYRWTAPELLFGADPHVTKESDLWSLGMVLYELLALQQPFGEMQTPRVVLALNGGQRPQRPGPDAVVRGLSDDVWTLIQTCWSAEPEKRPATEDVLQVLHKFV